MENYQPPPQALDPERFKEWRDTICRDRVPESWTKVIVPSSIAPKVMGRAAVGFASSASVHRPLLCCGAPGSESMAQVRR